MTSNLGSPPPTGPVVPSVAAASSDLATAVDRLAGADRATRDAVLALSATVGTGVCETVEGLPPDLVLANLCRLIRADRSTILTAADVLRALPATAGLWRAGVLSWGQVRNVCAKASKLQVADREVLDRRIAVTAEDATRTVRTGCWTRSTGQCGTSRTSLVPNGPKSAVSRRTSCRSKPGWMAG